MIHSYYQGAIKRIYLEIKDCVSELEIKQDNDFANISQQ